MDHEDLSEEDRQKRRAQRVPTHLSGRMKAPMPEERWSGGGSAIQDISVRGVFIETQAPLLVGDEVTFEMTLPESQQSVEIVGIVRWTRTDDPRGVGVEFLEVR